MCLYVYKYVYVQERNQHYFDQLGKSKMSSIDDVI